LPEHLRDNAALKCAFALKRAAQGKFRVNVVGSAYNGFVNYGVWSLGRNDYLMICGVNVK